MALQLQIEQGGILEHDAAESKKQGAAVWYKDEGGQHKCILLMHCSFAGPVGGLGRVLAEAVVAGRAAHATP